MNKSIRFILFSALAILFGIVCKDDYAVFFQKADSVQSIVSVTAKANFPVSTGVKKENKGHINNAIRIKARHDGGALNISEVPDFVSVCVYSPKVIYGGYRQNVLPVHFSNSGLRGPPLA